MADAEYTSTVAMAVYLVHATVSSQQMAFDFAYADRISKFTHGSYAEKVQQDFKHTITNIKQNR